MKAFRVRLVVILTLGIVIGVAAWAQVYPGGNPYNPYTGKPMPQQGAYNPLVGNYQGEKTTATPTSPQVYKWPKGEPSQFGDPGAILRV